MPAAHKVTLTDRTLKALRPAPAGKRSVIWDALQPHLGVRMTDKADSEGKAAHIAFVVVRRRPGERNPDTRVLGTYPATTLASAREKAPGILAEIMAGKRQTDIKEERRRAAEERRRADAEKRRDTVAVAVEAFVADERSMGLRTAHETEAFLRREFLGQTWERKDGAIKWSDGKHPIWRDRPARDITRRDVIARLDEIKRRGGLHAARHSLSAIRKFFNWCAEGERYGISVSPCTAVRDKTIGIKNDQLRRNRVLSDDELRDVWNAAESIGYPFGRLVRMLMLTGQRLNDIASAMWGEINIDAGLLTVPPQRYKTGTAHLVPLSEPAMDIVRSLPRFTGGDYLFSNTSGKKPISGMAKSRLDAAIAKARKEGGAAPMPPWVLHDLRRTARTRLGNLGVEDFIAERIIGHTLPGLHKVYHQGSHLEAKRAGLDKWAERLLAFVAPQVPKPGNVITMKRRA
jgi:integrase